MPALQLKLLAVLTALIVFVGAIYGYLAERGLQERESESISRSLRERAALVGELTAHLRVDRASTADLDAFADRLAESANARVTLIAPDGTVVGDSDIPLERLAQMENHADRPEVRAALEGKTAESTRRSGTVGRPLLYLASPLRGGGVVRLAVDRSELDAAVYHLRVELLSALLIGLVAALAVSFVLSWLTLRPIREMRRVTASIAQGDLDTRLPLRLSDELGDISTAINRMAEQLRQQLDETKAETERLQAVLNAMVEGVLVVDANGGVLLANDRLREIYGVWDDIRGREALAVVRNADFGELLTEAGSTDDPVSREIEVGGLNSRALRVHAVRFPSGDGLRLGTVAVFHDLTELRRLELVRQDFVANASHELRTPLAAVQGFTETLLHNADLSEENRRNYLGIIERHALRLGHIVDDLLVLSRAESGDARFDFAEVDVARVARSLIDDARARFAARRLTVELLVHGPGTAWADRQALEQVLTNLLDNAAKYTEPGGRIEVGIEVSGSRLRTRVSDTGIGIPENDLSRIFERFYRVDKARSRALGGTGLGLSIVRHLVHRLGGEISVESVPGEGSTFSFTLPRNKPDAAGT